MRSLCGKLNYEKLVFRLATIRQRLAFVDQLLAWLMP